MKTNPFKKQVWLWPYKAPGIVGSGSYDITIVCGPRDDMRPFRGVPTGGVWGGVAPPQ